MGNLVLDSLEIYRFRAFQHLTINHLGRVTLIVGKNNVGKSSLLDALQLYAQRASPLVIRQILGTHDENKRTRASRGTSFEEALSAARYLFYGRKEIKVPMEPIIVGPIEPANSRLSLNVQKYNRRIDEDGFPVLQKVLFEDLDLIEVSTPRFTVQVGNQREYNFAIDTSNAAKTFRSELEEIACYFIDANGLNRGEVGALWDSIALTDGENEVLNALRLIAPGVEDISVVGDPASARERITIVKVVGMDDPLPIRSLGDGMQRMLGIALALVNARDGLLLIDEIENGLHYSVQLDLWRLIFSLSRRLNVQVFATSHSWDCIKAFQKAAQEDEDEEGVLIRLENKKGIVTETIFDEHKLAIATREQIEVR